MPLRIEVPTSLRRVAVRQEGLVSARQCRAHGLSHRQTADLVSRARWGRPLRGVLDTGDAGASDLDEYDRSRRRTAVLGLLARPGSVATGLSALVLHGVQGAPIRFDAEVGFPNGSPRSAGPVRVRRTPVPRWNLVDGLPCVPVEVALAQAVPELDRRHAVALMDSALRRKKLTESTFRRARASSRGRRGARRSGPWWDESDRRAESPAETWARLSCVDSGCPPDALQLVVRSTQGRFLARVDLAWRLPGGGVLLVEIDGRDVHSRLDALTDDRRRQNGLADRRTMLLRLSGTDAWRGDVGPQVAAVLAREGWVPRPQATDRPFLVAT